MSKKLNEIINKYPILVELKEERVFNIDDDDGNDKPYIFEMCDEYFSTTLLRDDCIQLSEFFKELSEIAAKDMTEVHCCFTCKYNSNKLTYKNTICEKNNENAKTFGIKDECGYYE